MYVDYLMYGSTDSHTALAKISTMKDKTKIKLLDVGSLRINFTGWFTDSVIPVL